MLKLDNGVSTHCWAFGIAVIFDLFARTRPPQFCRCESIVEKTRKESRENAGALPKLDLCLCLVLEGGSGCVIYGSGKTQSVIGGAVHHNMLCHTTRMHTSCSLHTCTFRSNGVQWSSIQYVRLQREWPVFTLKGKNRVVICVKQMTCYVFCYYRFC